MNKINRNLISYAKVHTGEKFKPSEFASFAADLYGLKINPIAIEGLTPRLEKAGILQKFQVDDKTHEYAYAPIEQEFDDVSDKEIKYLLEKFLTFCRVLKNHNDTLDIDEDKLKSEFLAHIVNMDFIGVLLKPEKPIGQSPNTLTLPKKAEEAKWVEEKEAKSKVEVLCAAFVARLYNEEPDTYKLLTRITAGALLAEVVLNFQSPETNIALSGLRVVLDAPFLMGLLNLSSEESYEATKEICDLLREKGAELCVFQHSVEELKSNLQAVINAFNKKEGFGPTARRLLKQTFYSYAISMKDKPEYRIASEKIKIIKAPAAKDSFQWLTQEDENKLFRSLGYYQNNKAQEVDTESVAGVIRLRRGNRAKMDKLHTSKMIFVTSNPWIADRTAQCLVQLNLLSQDETPPCMSDRTIAGLLWVLYGGQSGDLPAHILLANCASTLDPKPDLIRQMHTFLTDIDDKQAEYFEALMTDNRAAQYLSEATLGDSQYINEENVVQILDHIKSALVEEKNVEHNKHIDSVIAKHSVKLEELEKAASSARDEKIDVETDLLKAKSELNKTTALLEQKEQEKIDKLEKQLTKAVNHAKRKVRTLILLIAFGVVVVGSAISGLIGYLTTSIIFGSVGIVISVLVSVVGFWKVPDLLFEKFIEKKKLQYFAQSCNEQIIDKNWVTSVDVDLSRNVVKRK
mgnify:CR=1 FL=1